MKNWLQNFGYKIRSLMYGRYGVDELSKSLIITSLVFMVFSFIPKLRILYFLSTITLFWSLFRSYSKNINKRSSERQKYLQFNENLKSEITFIKDKWKQRKTHYYFKCKSCKAKIRIPKGKGKIEVTCPKCKIVVIKNT